MRRERGETCFARTTPLGFPLAHKDSRRRIVKGKANHLTRDALPKPALAVACALRRFGRSCPRWRLEFVLQGGKKRGACLSEASLPLSPPCNTNSRRGSPSRARLSLLTFFGKTKKVSRPRQGTKPRMDHRTKTKPSSPPNKNITSNHPTPNSTPAHSPPAPRTPRGPAPWCARPRASSPCPPAGAARGRRVRPGRRRRPG